MSIQLAEVARSLPFVGLFIPGPQLNGPFSRRRALQIFGVVGTAGASLPLLAGCEGSDPYAILREYVYSGEFPLNFTQEQRLDSIVTVTWEDFNVKYPTGKPKPKVSYVTAVDFRKQANERYKALGFPGGPSEEVLKEKALWTSLDGSQIFINSEAQVIKDFQNKRDDNGDLQQILFDRDYNLWLASNLFSQYTEVASTYIKSKEEMDSVTLGSVAILIDNYYGLAAYGYDGLFQRISLNGFQLGSQTIIANEMSQNKGLIGKEVDNEFSYIVKLIQKRLGIPTYELYQYMREDDPFGLIQVILNRLKRNTPDADEQELLTTAFTIWSIPSQVKYEALQYNTALSYIEYLTPQRSFEFGEFQGIQPTPHPTDDSLGQNESLGIYEGLSYSPFNGMRKFTSPRDLLANNRVDLDQFGLILRNRTANKPRGLAGLITYIGDQVVMGFREEENRRTGVSVIYS